MNLPGTPGHTYVDHDNPDELAAWMLSIVDESPDRLAFIHIRRTDSEAKLDEMEARMIVAYDLAKAERPDLGVKMLPAVFAGERAADTALVVVVHEHRWVGGRCVNGCRDTR